MDFPLRREPYCLRSRLRRLSFLSVFCWSVAVSALGVLGCGRPTSTPESVDFAVPAADVDPLVVVRQAIQVRDWSTAKGHIESLLVASPDDTALLELAADIAIAQGQSQAAAELLERAVAVAAPVPGERFDKLGQLYMQLGQPFEALRTLQSLVKAQPDNIKARTDFAGLLASLGLELRAAEHLQYLVQHQQAGVNELIMLTDLTRPQTDEAICNYALKIDPTDTRPQYALARSLAYHRDWAGARRLLEPVCQRHPEFVEAWAYYGRAIVELGDEAAIVKWSASLPRNIESQPQYWLAAGVWAEKQSRLDVASHAYWRASSLNENDGESLTRLGTCLAELGRSDDSHRASHRAGLITAMRDDVESLFSWRNHSQRAAVQLAQSMNRLGRIWEAATWARIAVMMTQDPDPRAASVFRDLRNQMTGQSPWQSPEMLVTRAIDVAGLPEIDWRLHTAREPEAVVDSSANRIRFADEAEARGLNYICAIDKPLGEESSLWIYQSGAGGAAVIDVDLDGWPDFYFTSCDGVPKQRDSQPNRLFRNVAGHFVDVTEVAGAGERGYSQGVAAGDYNSDGFPDLMVANFGENRLLRNNGDGSLTDVTSAVGLAGDAWTTSIAIADLDGDAIADIFEVNYIAGDDVITQPCFPDGMTTHRSCGPLGYPAAIDRVWQGRGDGTFADASGRWMDDASPGRGLGLLVGQLDHQPGLDIYVANDMTANQFWSLQGGAALSNVAAPVTFVEQAAVRGLAFNERSLSQASMGIAADDHDGDGDLDFYVTHFTDDYNTLYQQISPGIWADRTSVAGLVEPTHSMLAYGTQWIDADNDGALELVIANGNVDDFTHSGHAYRMPMQLFRRDTRGHYSPQPADMLGAYFESSRLGRSLVSVDANRDRRVDLLVTHLFDPVSLLVNSTEIAAGTDHSLTLSLVGTQSHRDAIGAVVQVKVGEQTWTRHLLAGNGYQCSNQRRVTFGLGTSTTVDRVQITWPNGVTSSALNLQADQDFTWIEGEMSPFRMN